MMRSQNYVELSPWVPISDKLWLHTDACYTFAGPEAVVPETETANTCAKIKTTGSLKHEESCPLPGTSHLREPR